MENIAEEKKEEEKIIIIDVPWTPKKQQAQNRPKNRRHDTQAQTKQSNAITDESRRIAEMQEEIKRLKDVVEMQAKKIDELTGPKECKADSQVNVTVHMDEYQECFQRIGDKDCFVHRYGAPAKLLPKLKTDGYVWNARLRRYEK
jgi:hypothetical protein